jgi:hypothetical protein
MKRIVFISLILILSKQIVSRDDCDSQPNDPVKAAECCSNNENLGYCSLPSNNSAPQAIVGGGGGGAGKEDSKNSMRMMASPQSMMGSSRNSSRHFGSFFPFPPMNFCHHKLCCWFCMFRYGYGTWNYWMCVWWYCRFWHPWQRLSARSAGRAVSRASSQMGFMGQRDDPF